MIKKAFLLLFITAAAYGSDPLAELKAGNKRFVNNDPRFEKLSLEERKKLSLSQTPYATIVACSDSRVSPETLFDQGLGELFVVRLAGNTVDSFALASIEFGISYLKTPLLVILGHQDCGAVIAAFDLHEGDFSPELLSLLKNIEPAVKQAIEQNPDKPRSEQVKAAIKLNVEHTRQQILQGIPAAAKLAKEGRLDIQNAVFNIATGEVSWEGDDDR